MMVPRQIWRAALALALVCLGYGCDDADFASGAAAQKKEKGDGSDGDQGEDGEDGSGAGGEDGNGEDDTLGGTGEEPLEVEVKDQDAVLNLCKTRRNETMTAVLHAPERKNCAWGQNGNLTELQAHLQAREVQEAPVDIPANAVICSM